MYKDCYRGLTAIKEVLGQIIWDIMDDFDGPYLTPTYVTEKVSQWLVDNEYEISKYGIPDDDIKELQDNLTVRLERTEDEQAELDRLQSERLTGSLDLTNLIIPPAKKMDRCPEDILKEEIEK